MEFAVWEACERFGIRPPGIKLSWDEMSEDVISQSLLIAYNQIRDQENKKWQMELAGAKAI